MASPQVIIDCPRCEGTGVYGDPDAVCYRCNGVRRVVVDIPKQRRKLEKLRRKYVYLRRRLLITTIPDEKKVVRIALRECMAHGLRIREDLELAEASR